MSRCTSSRVKRTTSRVIKEPVRLPLLFLVVLVPAWASQPKIEDASVVIYTYLGNGKGGLGSGFAVSAAGEIVTCYHVIKDALSLQVFIGKEMYSNVKITGMDPDHDLAKLKIVNLTKPTAFIPISDEDPSTFSNRELETFGGTWLLRDQHLRAHTTRNGFVHSEEFRDETSARLFALRQVDLIALDMTIYRGLSGAPLLLDGRAVGVISGSIQEGGSIAWAIPVKYLENLPLVGKTVREINSWPPLALMAGHWKNVRRDADLGVPVGLALDQFGSLIEDLESNVRKLSPALFLDIKKAVDEQIAHASPSAAVDTRTALLIEKAMLSHNMSLSELYQVMKSTVALNERADEISDDLDRGVDEYFRALPKTKRNKTLQKLIKQRIQRIKESLAGLEKQERAANGKLDAVQGNNLGAMSQAFGILAEYLSAINLDEYFSDARAFAEVMEHMLEAAERE